MRDAFDLALARVDDVARFVVIGCMIVMITVVSAQVFMRYILNDSLDWADEVSRLAFVWSIFLAIPLGIREGAHVGIDILTSRFPVTVSRKLGRVLYFLAFLLMCVVVVTGIDVAAETWSERLGAINMTSSSFFIAVVIGSAHAALHLLHLVLYPEPVDRMVMP